MSPKIVKLTEKQILNEFLKAFADSNLSIYKSDYYCGITDDLNRRAKEHNVDGYCLTMNLITFEAARDIEQKLSSLGFDCGDQLGNGNEKSVYVYMCYKSPGFKK
ncbi:hypothetical protein V7T18_12410 [Segatella copri]|uniref:hypothetical protein n=1 Tax=Segatella copri TaxID=165179 RepID=UPI002FEF8328